MNRLVAILLLLSTCACAAGELPGTSANLPTRFTNSLGMPFAPVPGSRTRLAIWETRVADFQAFSRAAQRPVTSAAFPQTTNDPVVEVTWEDAQAFCAWLTEHERGTGLLPTATRYRLPTDAEWSAAAGLEDPTPVWPEDRLQQTVAWPWGTHWPPAPGDGNYAPELRTDTFEFTAPVSSFKPNRHGFFDLGGNVWEWCDDWFNQARVTKALRGGSFHDAQPRDLLTAYRFSATVHLGNDDIGFRLALAPDK